MNGQEYLSGLPEEPNEERNRLTLAAISDGTLIVEWSEIESTYKNHIGKFNVSLDAAYCILDNCSRFRPQFSAAMAVQAAELVGGLLITPKLMDLRHLASNKLNATLLNAGPEMSSTSYSKNYNEKLEAKRGDYQGIVSDCGKAWVLSNRLASSAGAVNYGFYDRSAPFTNPRGLKMWQTLGGMHNSNHQDYSQVLLLMGYMCEIDGQSMSVIDVMTNPELCGLISDEGIIKYRK